MKSSRRRLIFKSLNLSFRAKWLWLAPILAISLLASPALIPSPYVYQPGVEITESELHGMAWYFTNKESSQESYFVGYGILQDRYYDALKFFYPSSVANLKRPSETQQVPLHFGYDSVSSVSEILQTHSLVVISTYNRQAYTTIWSSANLYTSEDFKSLDLDSSISLVFSSTDIDIYHVG